MDKCISGCIPEAVDINVDCRSVAPVGPPTRESGTLHSGGIVVVFIQTTKLHPVGDSGWTNWCGNCVSLVSAESTHSQAILVRLWT